MNDSRHHRRKRCYKHRSITPNFKRSITFDPLLYGENLNALWDCLTGWIEYPLTLVWKNFEASQKALGSDADDVLELLQEAQEELGNRFVIQIDQPSAGTTDRH